MDLRFDWCFDAYVVLKTVTPFVVTVAADAGDRSYESYSE